MVGGSKSHTPFDSRLLLSLVKCEKEVADSFKSYTQTCENANNALNGWAAADTGDSPDVLTASNRVCELFDETFDAQRTYLMALNNYRSSLKDVAAREAEIRVILRDRDIFVSRLVKLNNKKPPTSDSAFEAHTAKLEEARAELAACESTLKAEERALVGVKRRIFREALRMRMRAMAQLADTWRDTAERAIDILDSLEPDNNPNGSMTDLRLRPQPPPPTQLAHTPSRHSNNRLDTFQSPEGSVIAPSHSASQVARRAAGIPADFSDDEGDTALGGVRDNGSLHRSASMNDNNINGSANRRSIANPPIAEVSHEEEEMAASQPVQQHHAHNHNYHQQQRSSAQNNRVEEEEEEGGGSSEDERGHELDPKMYQVHVNKPLTPRELAQQKARQLMAQKQHDERQMVQPQAQGQQQYQQQASQQPVQQAAAPARKRTSSTPVQSPTSTATPQPLPQQGVPTRTASPYRETPEDRMKRFSTLTTTTMPPYDAATAPIAIPSAGTFTLESYKKKNAPEATLMLPSTTGLKGYQATRAAESDDEAVDEVGALQKSGNRRRTASTPGRPSHGRTFSNESESVTSDGGRGERRTLKKLPSGRDSAYYSRSDAGTSTVRGGEKRSHKEKNRHEGHHKSSSGGGGGFFGAIGGLFKKRDIQSGRKYGDDDDDDDSVLGSPKSRGTRAERNSSIWGGGSSKKKDRKSRIMEDSDSDAPDPRTLIKVENNAGRGRALGGSGALSDIAVDRQTEAAIRAAVNSNTFSSVGPDRKKAMSDVGAPRALKTTGTVKKKKTTTGTAAGLASPGATSPISQATTLQPSGIVKKKKKVSSSGPTSTTVANNLAPATSGLPGTMMIVSSSTPNLSRSNTMTSQNAAQRVTRETPSLMSVVAPPSQSSRVMNMPLPSAKNPSASATPKSPVSPAGSALGVPDQPLKKKKTVKRSSTSTNVNGNLLVAPTTASTLRPSATTPNLLSPGSASTGPLKPAVKASSALSAPRGEERRPASILSVGSGAGGVARRKSVRLADDTKLTEAKYENSGPPANISRVASPPVTNMNGSAHHGILKESANAAQTNHNVHDYTDAGTTTGAGVGEWSTRPGPEDDVSSDEGGDEYARIRHQLSRSERGWKDAGFLEKGKGKARAY